MKTYSQNALDYVDLIPGLLFTINESGKIAFIIPWWMGMIILAVAIYFLGRFIFPNYWTDVVLIDGTLMERGFFLTIPLVFVAFFYVMGFISSIKHNIIENLDNHPKKSEIIIKDW